ncbi:MAG TPA: EAL domain-containing protein [Candidatus Xenobia bacterium]|jgi:diguanylate cyclase (GGDEF)-like protein/PAS domain S-box-containing protein
MSHRVLYVSADQAEQQAFQALVRDEDLHWQYRLAASVAEAKTCIEAAPFDAIVAAFGLPDGGALQLLDLQLETPVLIVAEPAQAESAIKAIRAGAADYLLKDAHGGHFKLLAVTVEKAVRTSHALAQSTMYSQALTSVGDSVHIVDADQRVVFVNRAFCETYGFKEADIVGRDAHTLWVHPADCEAFRAAAAVTGEPTYHAEVLHRRASGEVFPVRLTRSVSQRHARHGESRSLEVVVARDISDRVAAQTALQESQARYEASVQGANDGMWDWNLRTNEIDYSSRWKAMLGWIDGMMGRAPQEWFGRVHPDDLGGLQTAISNHLRGTTGHMEHEHRMQHRDGSWRWMVSRGLAVRDGTGVPFRMAGSHSDHTARRDAEQQLAHRSLHDGLTGLPNRALFMDRLGQALERQRRRPEYSFAVIFLDVDNFKIINNSLGHSIGDELLAAFAHRLQLALRPTDTVARLGGDEFAILVDDTQEPSDVSVVADRIQKSLNLPFRIADEDVFCTASLGIALSSRGYSKAEDFLRDADIAMYRAKAHGRGHHELFNAGMHDSVLAMLRLESDLWKALEHEEFILHYQPVVSLESGYIIGAEALLRWNHPQRGMVSPAEFIPLAEETGLIVSIGEWVLQEACTQNKRWHEQGYGELHVMVNVSARQFHQPTLHDTVARALSGSGLAATWLTLEITESTAMKSLEASLQMLRALRALGVSLSIDDFGTGYSSLGCLKMFPITSLKLDQSFVRGTTADTEDAAITRAIISMAHSLKMEVVAEGVETRDELDFLRGEGCDAVQGFLYSRPLSSVQLTQLLEQGRILKPGR